MSNEPCLQVVQDTQRFVTYCALPFGHEGDHDDVIQTDWMTIANATSLQALDALRCAKVADVEYGCELRCTLEAGHEGACTL